MAAKQRLAFVPDVPRFYQELTAWEHLNFVALAHNAVEGFEERAEILLGEFGLWEARNVFPHAFSRGMRLKLGIMLALIRPFRALLMDEPTSALDTESEALIASALEHLMSGRTVFVIAHRFSLIRDVDKIVVLEKGEIVEAGTREELLGIRGLYSELHSLQEGAINVDLAP